ncbi:unnamed protein product, partial [Prorocentrum cordatum]
MQHLKNAARVSVRSGQLKRMRRRRRRRQEEEEEEEGSSPPLQPPAARFWPCARRRGPRGAGRSARRAGENTRGRHGAAGGGRGGGRARMHRRRRRCIGDVGVGQLGLHIKPRRRRIGDAGAINRPQPLGPHLGGREQQGPGANLRLTGALAPSSQAGTLSGGGPRSSSPRLRARRRPRRLHRQLRVPAHTRRSSVTPEMPALSRSDNIFWMS